MEQVDVVAVVGSCVPERQHYARRLAAATRRRLVAARQLRSSRNPVEEAAAIAAWSGAPAGAVLELPDVVAMPEVIAVLADPHGSTRLTGVVCVVDAAHLLDDLAREDYVHHRSTPWRDGPADLHVAHALLTASGIEYASLVVLVGWTALSTPDLSTVMALVSHLSPRSRLRLDLPGGSPLPGEVPPGSAGAAAYGVRQERPGWVCLLNGDFDPHMTDPRVAALHYESVRPLHPGRLLRLLDERVETGAFGTVIRSAGFCRFATRPGVVARWEHVGHMISFEPLASDDDVVEGAEVLAVGQELGIVGLDLDRAGLAAALDEVALSADELAAGPAAWAAYDDPFPAWPAVADRAE